MPAAGGDDAVLEKALQDLQQAFRSTGEAWRDQTRDDFARQHLDPLTGRVRETSRALAQLNHLIAEARRACS
jgi:hypothetical protein